MVLKKWSQVDGPCGPDNSGNIISKNHWFQWFSFAPQWTSGFIYHSEETTGYKDSINFQWKLNSWHLISIKIVAGVSHNMYVDWILIKSTPYTKIPNFFNSDNLLIWWPYNVHCWWNWVFNWLIDEVRIYNRALSDSEIYALYNATR